MTCAESIGGDALPDQGKEGGSTPTSALRQYRVRPIGFDAARELLAKWHYNPYTDVQAKHVFGVFSPPKKSEGLGLEEPELHGVCVFTRPAGPTAGKTYCPDHPTLVLELRRLACIDDTPKGLESYFVGYCLRWLRKNTEWRCVISYADPEQGHTGIIYRASNFEYLGVTSPGKVLLVDGQEYHIRTLSMLDRDYGRTIAARHKAKDPGIQFRKTLPKHIYRYWLR